MSDYPALALSPSESADARKWLSDRFTPHLVEIKGDDPNDGYTKERAQSLTQPELEQAVSKAVSGHNGWHVDPDNWPKSLQGNKNALLAYGKGLLERGNSLSDIVADKPSLVKALGGTENDFGARPRFLISNAGLLPGKLNSTRKAQRDFVERWSPPGTIEKANGLPIHQKEAYVAILAERILDNAPKSTKVNEKTFASRIKPETALAEASQVKGFRQVQAKLPEDTRWAAFNAGQAKVEITEKTLNDASFSAPPGLESVNPFKGYSASGLSAIASAFGHNVNERWESHWASGSQRSNNQAANNIASLFGKDTEAATRYVEAFTMAKVNPDRAQAGIPQRPYAEMFPAGDPKNITNLHDAGQFQVPKDEMNKAEWGKFLAKNPEGMQFLDAAPSFEKEHGRVANSTKELRNFSIMKSVGSEFGTESKSATYVLHAALAGVPNRDIRRAIGYRGQEKTRQDIPDIKIEGKGVATGFTIRQLDMGDFRALTIGHESSCCQRLESAGESCAIHSFKEPSSGVFVIENKEGELMAQTWAWTDKDKSTIVFDSVESHRFDDKVVNATAELISALSADLGEKGFKAMLSNTSYGMTMQVGDAIGVKEEHLKAPPSMAVRSSYSDVKGKIYDMAPHLKERAERLAEGKSGIDGVGQAAAVQRDGPRDGEFGDRLMRAVAQGRPDEVRALIKDMGPATGLDASVARAIMENKNPEVRAALIELAANSAGAGIASGRSSPGKRLTTTAMENGDVAFVAAVVGHPENKDPLNMIPQGLYKLSPEGRDTLIKAVPAYASDVEQLIGNRENMRAAASAGNYALVATVMGDELRATKGLTYSSLGIPSKTTSPEDFLKVAIAVIRDGFVAKEQGGFAVVRPGLPDSAEDSGIMFRKAIHSERADMMKAVSSVTEHLPRLSDATTEKQVGLVLAAIAEMGGDRAKPALDEVRLSPANAGVLVKQGVDPSHIAEALMGSKPGPFLGASLDYLRGSGANLDKVLANVLAKEPSVHGWDVHNTSELVRAGANVSSPVVVEAALSGKVAAHRVDALMSSGMRIGEQAATIGEPPKGCDARVKAAHAAAALFTAEPGAKLGGPGADAVLQDVVVNAAQNYREQGNLAAITMDKIVDKPQSIAAIHAVADSYRPRPDQLIVVAEVAVQKGAVTPADFAKAIPGKEETLGQAISRVAGPEATAALYKSAQEVSATRKQAENSPETAKTATKPQEKGR